MSNNAFSIGDEVRAIKRVYNDGSFPNAERGSLIVKKGTIGEVREMGVFLQTDVIYSVFFPEYGYAVGMRENELLAGSEPWWPSRFEFKQKVRTLCGLSVKGQLRVEHGAVGQILRVERDEQNIHYQVNFGDDKLYLIGESLLEAADESS
ncbi:nitrogen fixation protein NifZ [Celerinatantimonas diazotrophica]|uniref:Nitrogen fixation protein NifZ n=1 Tax=Celerinatantimonas diazotrophica TaxID=412034 RepID=A0A4R1KGY1_9GAMM|nr:nitrogen fixation protein NifZ [Celerinatantimonas diazotrophica]TCK64025.1 nitrogen fixation protein NifZ [Celerinatantimonas diazotrophica]CAG9297116.1 hypothetical protein CEDIAZO_02284 [Celerinatantimonas diazotrophica]